MTLQLRPTFSESWYRVQNLKPRLRATAQISRQYYRGERWYVVRDPAGNQYHRLSDTAYAFVGLLDGSRSVGECWELVGGQLADDAPTQPEIIQILSQLYSANLIETNVTPDATVLLRRHKKLVQQKTKGRLMNILFPRIKLWDPDNFLRRWMPLMKPMLGPVGTVIWLVTVLAALLMIAPEGARLVQAGKDAINLTGNPSNALLLYGSFIAIKFIHELGHAFTCRRFGGEVHELGIMFLVLFPAPYVDASSAWSFSNKWHRILVGAGGMIFELFVAALCAFYWLNTNPGDLTNQLAYNVMLIASVSTLIFNANPLLRYDGYYILSDFLEIPNLQRKSTEYTLGLVKRHIFRVKATQPLPPLGQRAWLFVYACASTCYRLFVGFAIMLMVLFQLPQEIRLLGLFLGLSSVATFFVMPLFKLFKYLTTDPELHRKRGRAWLFTGVCAAGLVLLTGVIQWPLHVRAEGVVDASERAMVRPRSPGFVSEIYAQDQQLVRRGEMLMQLRNDDLELRVAMLRNQLQQVDVKITASMQNDVQTGIIAINEREAVQKQLDSELVRQGDLTIRAPIDGLFIAPELANMRGLWVDVAKEVGKIARNDDLVVYAVLDQSEAGIVTGQMRASKGTVAAPIATIIQSNDAVVPTTQAAPKGYDVDSKQLADATELRLVSNQWTNITPISAKIVPAASNEARSPALTLSGGGQQLPDASSTQQLRLKSAQYELQFVFPNAGGKYIPGQRVYVRMRMPEDRSLLWQGWRKLLQLIQTTATS